MPFKGPQALACILGFILGSLCLQACLDEPGGAGPEGGSTFLSVRNVAPGLDVKVSERELRVAVYPGARFIRKRSYHQGERLCLVYVTPDEPRFVVSFYEARLAQRATLARGLSGEQYTLVAVGSGRRTMVVVERRVVRGRPAGSEIRLVSEPLLPGKNSRARRRR